MNLFSASALSRFKSTLDPIPVTPGRQEIVDLYAETLANLKNMLVGEDFTQASKRRAAEKIAEIHRHIRVLKRKNLAWCEKYIPKAYKNGFYQDNKLLKRFKGNEYTAQFSRLHREAAQIAVEGAMRDYLTVADALQQTFVGYIEYSRYTGNKRFIAREIAGGIIEGAGRQTLNQRLLSRMKGKIVEGKITVGAVTMNAKSYADLLTRTISRAARTEGTINRLNEAGIDLVIITDTGAIDFCREFENQIFSMSGRSNKYPKLVLRPPYHPNCTHNLSGFIAEFAEPGEITLGSQFKKSDVNLSPKELAKKYPIRKAA